MVRSLHGSYIRTPQEIPKVPVSEHTSSNVSHWSNRRATSFHEVVEASYSDPSIIRNKDCDLPRRYSGYASGDQNHQEMIKIFHMLTGLLENLGFIIKQEKYSPFPTQELVFLGAQLNSKEMTLAVPLEKLQNLQTEWESRNAQCTVVGNDWQNEPDGKDWPLGRSFPLPCIAKVLHHMAAQDWLSHAIPTDPDYPQPSVDDRTTVVDFTKVDRTQQDVLTPPANRHDDYHRCVDQRLGSSLFRNKDRGHINYLELKAALLAIQSFFKDQAQMPRHLRLLMDNSTADRSVTPGLCISTFQ